MQQIEVTYVTNEGFLCYKWRVLMLQMDSIYICKWRVPIEYICDKM